MDSERQGLADSNAPKGRDTGGLNSILSRNLEKIETRQAKEASERRSKPEEKPVEAADKGQAKIEAKSDDGKRQEPKRDGAKEPAEKAAKETPAPEAGDNSFAPKTWTEAERKAFDGAPTEVQEAINKMVKNLQQGWTKKTTALADDSRLASEIREALQPDDRELLKSNGLSEGKALKELLTLYKAVKSDPVSFVSRLIQRNGITPDKLGFTSPQGNGHAPQPDPSRQAHADPIVAQLQSELNALKGVWTQAQTQHAQTVQQKEQSVLQETHNLIVNFVNEIDDSGMPAHPHWEAVQRHVLMIARDDPEIAELPAREKLQAAYERAIWANPATKAAMLEAEKAKTTAEVERERARSARSIKPSGGSSGAVKGGRKSLDQLLEKNAKKLGI